MTSFHRRFSIASASLALACAPALADQWSGPQEPFAIYGNTYYVGVRGVSAVLITSPAGHILIDGDSPDSPQQIAAHIRQLGFKLSDVKYILNSHEHFDHAGGIAVLQKLTGATVLASHAGAAVLRSGKANPADPQFSKLPAMTPVAQVRAIDDHDVVTVGPLRLTVHYTPGHAPGGTSWTWQSTEHGKTVDLAYVDSLTAYAAAPFRYSGSASYPQARADLERSIGVVAALPCDILISAHPEAGDLWTRQAAAATAGHAAFIDPQACRNYAAKGQATLVARLAEEGAKR